MKVTIVPIVISALGKVTKWSIQGLEDLEITGRVQTIEIGQNIEKSTGDYRKFAVIQTTGKDHQLTLMWITLKE